MSSTMDAAVSSTRSSTGTREPSITMNATANAVSVGMGTPAPSRHAGSCAMPRYEQCRHHHGADGRRDRQQGLARSCQPPDRELALHLQPDREEEQGEQAVVDPVAQFQRQRVRAELQREVRPPELLDRGPEPAVAQYQCQQRGRSPAAAQPKAPSCRSWWRPHACGGPANPACASPSVCASQAPS